MQWFKHDADASIDAKLQMLLLDYGAAGYGLYWYCIELIAQGVDKNNITFELEHDARIIAKNLNLSIQETKDMMQKMIDLGLFSITTNNKLACYALAKRLDQSMTGSADFRKLINSIKTRHDGVMTKDDGVMNRIEENRIEENIKDKPATRNKLAQKPDGLPEDVWCDFKSQRKSKLTETALKQITKQAELAGWTLEQALTESITRGWQSFKAEWVNKQSNQPSTKSNTDIAYGWVD